MPRCIALALYAAGRLACFPAAGQEAPPVEVIVVPSGAAPPVSVGIPTPVSPVTAATVRKTPEERRGDELLKLKFDRGAAAILQAQNTLAAGTTPPEQPAERFRLNVVAGRWKHAGAFLKTLPPKDASRVYEHLLKDLDRVPVVTPAQGQQGAMPPPSTTLLQHDVLDLADIAPAPLTENSLKLLGALLVRIGGANPFFDPLIKRLQQGTSQLGGTDPQMRERAAELLLNANREIDAAQFLPPLEPGRETASVSLLEKHVRCALTEARTAQKKEGLARAWDLNLKLLSLKDLAGDVRERAWQRSAEMLPLLPYKLAMGWLNDLFRNDTTRALPMLSAVGAQIAKHRSSRDITQRKKNLELQDKVVGALVANAQGAVEWQPALNLFALNWLEEADYARRLHIPARNVRNVVEYDPYGNPIYYNSYGQPQMAQSNPNQLPAIPIAELLPLAPNTAWLAAIDDTLRPRTFAALAELHLKLEDETKALPYVEKLAPVHPKEAQRIANDLLRVWATSHDPQRNMPQRRSNVVYYGASGAYGMQGIPLTRALQERNLSELSAMLKRLRQLPIPELDESAIVTAFTMAHSQAEVFREEAIEQVLGKIDELPAKTLGEMLQTMRQRLATQWRRPNVQQQAKTQRTDAQIDAEILRGYELLDRLTTKGIARLPNEWRLNLARAATSFDWAEFQYGKKVDLAIYVEKRERAFEAFQRAASLYADGLAAIEEKDETPLIYQQWLNANLGASDLALVTRQQEPSANQIERIRQAILALPAGAAERHLDGLAKAVKSSTETLPAHLKPAYMRAAFSVIGERPEADEIRRLVDYYDGLLRELEFAARIDGDATVGHRDPFGIFFTIRHTAEIERENAGGFGKYLRNQSQNPYYYNPYGVAPIDHRDELEKQMREKLSEGFDILSITFHDEKVQSRGYGRAGWRETPLIYVLLKAKDGSVDRIPSLRLDLDFIDKHGPVVLPVESSVQLLDARPDSAPPRPVTAIDITQILDDRQLREGKLALEIKAVAKGLIPSFKELFDFAPPGFRIEEQTDSGPAIQKLASDGDELAAASERNWVIKLTRDPAAGNAAQFRFPHAKGDATKVAYKRYDDADLVEVDADLAVAGFPLRRSSIWWWVASGAAFLAVGALIATRLRRNGAAAEPTVAYSVPSEPTAFNTLQLLRQMFSDRQLAWSADQRSELAKTIAHIEAYFFAKSGTNEGTPDLETLGRTWVEQARTSAVPQR